jgi:exopolysaccharide biosynthesis polyprenyl glycosylphosphotransferase
MTVTMPLRTARRVDPVDVVRQPALPVVRFPGVTLLFDAVVPLAMLPLLLARAPGPRQLLTPTAVTVVVTWVVLLAAFGAYDASRRVVDADLLRRLAMAGVCVAALLPVLLAATGITVEPRRMLAAAALTTVAAVLERRAAQSFRSRAGHERSAVRVVVSGHRHAVDRVLAELAADTRSTFEVLQVCGPGRQGSELSSTAQQLGAEAVVVVPCRHHDPLSLRRLGWQLERTGVRLLVATGLHDVSRFRTTMEYAGAIPLVQVRPPGLDGARMRVKAVADAVVGVAAVVALAPVMLAIALVIMVESPGPALFRQTRVGKDGKLFTIFKFRTMCDGADLEHERLNAEVGDPSSVLFKLRSDPRVTRVGQFLRRYSLDELPQLLNVVRGDMSLVGPRPALPTEVERYEPDTRRRLAVRPGITGLWQVSGRSDLTWNESVRLDLRYVDNWSLAGDLRLVGRTFGAVVSHRGAY